MTSEQASPRPVRVPTGRTMRFGRMATLAVSLAGAAAASGLREVGRGRRPSSRDLLLTAANMRRVADELARMRGAAMKVGQILSMDGGEVLPPELASILARLRADADFMPPRQLKRVLSAEWGSEWLARFRSFDVRPIASASIGQVHKAVLKDGRRLAIKVQYPGVERSIDSDVANVGALIRLSGLVPRSFDLVPYLDEAKRQLREEADYRREAGYLRSFRQRLADDPAFLLPEIETDLTTERVLAMSFVPGDPIECVADLPQPERDEIGRRLLSLALRELFDFGLMQTDPNFANYRYHRDTGQIVLLDFGASRSFGRDIVALFRRLFDAGLTGDQGTLSEVAAEIGFITPSMSAAHRAEILALIGEVFAEIAHRPILDFAVTGLADRLQRRGEALARDGLAPPPVPMDTLYLQRKFAGTYLLLRRIGARVPVADLLAGSAGRAGSDTAA